MNKSFQMGTWLRWVNQLPSDAIRVRPVLCTQMGQAYMDTGNVHASESSLRDAEQALRLPPDEIIVVEKDQVPALPAQIAFARAYNAQSQGRSSAAVEYAQRALDLTPVEDVFLQAQVSTLLLATHWANGDLDGARQLIGDFVDASERAGHLFFAIAGAFGKADLLNAQGRLREVRRTYEAALELAAAHHAEQHTAHHHLGLGLVYHEMGEDERAARHLQKSFELGRQTTIVDWGYRKTLAQAQLKDAEGDLESALDLLEEAQRLYIRTPSPNLRPVDAMKARLHLKQGTLSKAQAWARTTGLSLRDYPDYLHEFERLTLARVALADYRDAPDEDRWLATLGLLDRHLELAEKQNRLRSQVDILVVRSLAFHARGEMADALAPLERALTLAEPEGFLRIFASEGKPMVQMLSQLKKRSLTPYVRRIQAFRGPLPSGPPTPVVRQPLVDPLSQRELGVLRLLAEGLSNQEIAQKLFVTLSTVKGHNLRIFAKLQVRNRTEAVARARELGLL
jgi:LuxR family maltose regulon positive regulatory protein